MFASGRTQTRAPASLGSTAGCPRRLRVRIKLRVSVRARCFVRVGVSVSVRLRLRLELRLKLRHRARVQYCWISWKTGLFIVCILGQ